MGSRQGRGIEGEMNLMSFRNSQGFQSGWRSGGGGVGMRSSGVDRLGLEAVVENLAFSLSEMGTSKVLSRT